jgi:hypothetical protein
MSKITFIIFLVVVAIQVVSSIAQKSAKLQRERRMKEMARQKQQGAPAGGHKPIRETSAVRPDVRSRADELAARRKQQLEQLRMRRAGRGAKPAAPQQMRGPAQTRISSPAPMQARQAGQQAAGRARRAIGVLRAGREAQLHAAEQRKRQRSLEVERREQVADEARRRREAEHRREVRQRVAAAAEAEPSAGAYDRPAAQHERAAGLRRALSNRSTLRSLFVMKELLEPPVALRTGIES